MAGDEKNPLFRVSKPIQGQPDRAATEHLSARVEKCVNHRVPRHEDARAWNSLREEVGACPVRGSEMKKRELGRETAVELLREWRQGVAGSQAGLNVPDRNAMIKAGQAHRERGRGVALDQDDVWLRLGEDAGHSIENAGR